MDIFKHITVSIYRTIKNAKSNVALIGVENPQEIIRIIKNIYPMLFIFYDKSRIRKDR